MNRTPALLLVFAISWAVASGAHALSYDEGIQGDLSGDFAASTVLGQLDGERDFDRRVDGGDGG